MIDIVLIDRSVSWEDAVYWFEQAVKTQDNDDGGQYDCTINDPSYTLLAKQADMYRKGGHGLDKDPQRAGQSTLVIMCVFTWSGSCTTCNFPCDMRELESI